MLFSYNWLKEYLEGASAPSVLAEKLTMSGTEIESVKKTGADFTGVVTAQVLTIDKHPNADKLSLCRVKTGSEELSIVCGARNMKPGDKVALAIIGAELPGGFKIKRSKIRGGVRGHDVLRGRLGSEHLRRHIDTSRSLGR
jgi:phenylalanyl-tRNA synthetase beta chain